MPHDFDVLEKGSLTSDDSLFDESELDDESFDLQRIARVVGLMVIILLVAWWCRQGPVSTSTDAVIQLAGPRVGQLQPGASVVLDGLKVGEVKSLRIEQAHAVADLAIDQSVLEQLPENTKYRVCSLNELTPGNIGVVIFVPDMESNAVTSTSTAWPSTDGSSRTVPSESREIRIAEEMLIPASAPIGLYVSVGVIALLAAICLGISLKISFTNWRRLIFGLGTLIYLFASFLGGKPFLLDELHALFK
ncbi:mce related protein [Thalassoglobus neptunius]|uniref:Mce related protein n=1 Tax=Thalassoglobus neptunius TaxID=1938619 RepID=A0A5C5VQE7_9PLAN|nr:MlaD family protein [Thalassoglobus neptunius]TWT40856.1 mce related protein [Thalassoglobus neptunius]